MRTTSRSAVLIVAEYVLSPVAFCARANASSSMTTFIRFIHAKCTLRAHDEQSEEVERRLCRDSFEETALHRPEQLPVLVRVRAGDGNVDRADRLCLRAAA